MEIEMATSSTVPVESTATTSVPSKQRLPVTVSKPIPYTFDLGNLLVNDSNPLPPDTSLTEADLISAARDSAQALINQLLTVCPLTSNSTGVSLTLPKPTTPLPREKPRPVEKGPTKWERFAAKKGIKSKRRGDKKVYDEAKEEWVNKWGYQGANKAGEGDWLVEVDDKKDTSDGGMDVRAEQRRERIERVKRNERKQRANERKVRKTGKS
ncbi:MAG: Rhodanese- sulfurtransferase [Cirrosporium novae-zelandiae]|nr:MAG: Rhodanese- sulfurtransferase [Cirrosporium novae-zelandiae]